MDVPLSLFLIIVAPFIGSFLGLLAMRLPEHEDVVVSRSRCRACNKTLGVSDLIPLVSYLMNKGGCAHCGDKIPRLYPLVEMGALGVAIAAVLLTTGPMAIVTCLLGWALLALAASDIRAMILPNVITFPLIPAGLAVSFLLPGQPVVEHLIGAFSGAFVLWAIAFGYEKLRGRRGLGMGDVKLFAAAGAWLGWAPLPYMMLMSSLIGIFAVLGMRLTGQKVSATTMLPFGAPLALSFYVLWLLKISVGL